MKKMLILFLLLPLVLCSCSEKDETVGDMTDEVVTTAADTTEQERYKVCVDWANFIKLDGTTYVGDWEQTEVSPENIGEKIGEITSGPPTVYADENGDVQNIDPPNGSSFGCPVSTEVFSVIGDESSVAAYVKGKYYLYTTE